MYRQSRTIGIIIGVLIVIGMVKEIYTNPAGWVIPLIIIGLVYYFYKNPPKNYRRGQPFFQSFNKPKAKKRRTAKFRVIPGSKKNEEQQEPPRYH